MVSLKNNLYWNANPWTPVYGSGRSILALGTFLTLFFNDPSILFKTAAGITDCPLCYDLSKIGIFCLLKSVSIQLAQYISLGILLLVIIGWRPQITGILHWWIAFSLNTNAITLDGGDQVASVLTLLLIPITLTDPRKSHWTTIPDTVQLNPYASSIANISRWILWLQISIIYFHAGVGKLKVGEWVDGTAIYYFLQDPLFAGAPDIIISIFRYPAILTFMTWGVLILETLLFLAIAVTLEKRKYLFIPALIFHIAIMFLLGLVSFGCSMTAALIFYLLPDNYKIKNVSIFATRWPRRLSTGA
jgi:antimicrobial peptide system SdpB family protein